MYAQSSLEEVASSLDALYPMKSNPSHAAAANDENESTLLPSSSKPAHSPFPTAASVSVSPAPAVAAALSGTREAPTGTRDKPSGAQDAPTATRDPPAANFAPADSRAVVESSVESATVGVDAATSPAPLSHAAADISSPVPLPPGTLCELPDGTQVDLSAVERRLEHAAPILFRAMVYHLPGQTYFVSLLALRTQPWQSVPPNVGGPHTATLPHHLLHEDVVSAIAARGSSAMTTMEAKSDKCAAAAAVSPA
jgi:hypothetical protein